MLWLSDRKAIRPVVQLCHLFTEVLFQNRWRKNTAGESSNQAHLENWRWNGEGGGGSFLLPCNSVSHSCIWKLSTLAAFSEKRNATVYRPSVRLSIPSAHLHNITYQGAARDAASIYFRLSITKDGDTCISV